MHGDSDDVAPVGNKWAVRQVGAGRSWRFDVDDRIAPAGGCPGSCRGHAPAGCVDTAAFDTWLDSR